MEEHTCKYLRHLHWSFLQILTDRKEYSLSVYCVLFDSLRFNIHNLNGYSQQYFELATIIADEETEIQNILINLATIM